MDYSNPLDLYNDQETRYCSHTMKLILMSLLALMPNTLGITLDDLVNPLALSITESVADNLTSVATTLIPNKTGHKFAPVHSLALTKVHQKFKQAAPQILKSHSKKILKIRKQFAKTSSKRQLSLARVESLLTLRDLQVKLFTLAREETAHLKRQTHALVEKR